MDQVVNLNNKYETCVEEIRKVRKCNEELEKATYTLAKTHKYVSSEFLSIYSSLKMHISGSYFK